MSAIPDQELAVWAKKKSVAGQLETFPLRDHPDLEGMNAINEALGWLAVADESDRHELPMRVLLPLARRVGVSALRLLAERLSPIGDSQQRIVIRNRKTSEYSKSDRSPSHKHPSRNRRQYILREVELIRFGNAVLRFDSELSRGEALEAAAEKLGRARGKRTLEADFRKFKAICRSQGYVPPEDELFGYGPQFSLADLDK